MTTEDERENENEDKNRLMNADQHRPTVRRVEKKAQEEITQRVAGRMQNKLRGKEYNRLLVVIFMLHKDVLPEIKKNSESMKEDDCKIRKTYFKRFKCRRLNLV